MCGRYTLHTTFDGWTETRLPWAPSPDLPPWTPRFNLAPTQTGLIVQNLADPRIVAARWGLVPAWAKDLTFGARAVNARAETLSERPAFREAYRSRRCVVLADGFYEWTAAEGGGRKKQAVYLRLASREPFVFAGLWERWRSPEGGTIGTFTIITTEPNRLVSTVHDRMPVILPTSAYSRWLAPEPRGELAGLLCPYPASEMELFEVDPRVGSPSHDAPSCIAPLAAQPLF